MEESGLNPWEYGGQRVKEEILLTCHTDVPQEDSWRLGLLDKLLTQRLTEYYIGNQIEDLEGMIISLVTN